MKKFFLFVLIFILVLGNNTFATTVKTQNLQNVKTELTRYPDYAKMYIGDDRFENFNRKMFSFNRKLNKYIAKPVHILWASIMPQYAMDRIKCAYTNIEYPKRLASCIIQRDGLGVKNETFRFLTNTTLGIGGLFDPAKKILKLNPINENMEQALCKCKMDSGPYMVMPILNSCTPRSLCGRTLEAALDPSVYLATPITAIVKFGLMVNNTSYMQPLAKMLESTYADPYDIQKKLFGLENYIRNSNLDRQNLIFNDENNFEKNNVDVDIVEDSFSKSDEEKLIENSNNLYLANNSLKNQSDENKTDDVNTGYASSISEKKYIDIVEQDEIKPDLILENFCPQCPIVDAMRTVFFENFNVNKSIWNELSIWNRSFVKKIKSEEISIDEVREKYKFYYILQKEKTAPLIILYPSIGEGASAHHSVMFAKMFYDKGFSVLMIGSHFQWQFVKSMPKGFCPGLPQNDVKFVREVTKKALDIIEKKNDEKFCNKTLLGTSFGALMVLFVADEEYKDSILKIDKFIAISPPIDLIYAINQLDKYSEEFDNTTDEIKHKTAVTAAKILQLAEQKNKFGKEIECLPFTKEEGNMITTFVLRQKLSDLIYTIEEMCGNKKTNIYEDINNLSYKNYVEKYILENKNLTFDDIKEDSCLYKLANYFIRNNNYIIYHSLDDYFINKNQLNKLKYLVGKNLICINCGSHLGFLYRKEFLNNLIHIIVG